MFDLNNSDGDQGSRVSIPTCSIIFRQATTVLFVVFCDLHDCLPSDDLTTT